MNKLEDVVLGSSGVHRCYTVSFVLQNITWILKVDFIYGGSRSIAVRGEFICVLGMCQL